MSWPYPFPVEDKFMWVTLNGEKLLEGISLENGKSNPFGWSSYDIVHTKAVGMIHDQEKIGSLYCGFPKDMKEGYGVSFES